MNSYKSCVTCGPCSPWEPLFPCSPLLPWKKNQALCIRKHVAYTALFFGMKLTLLQSIYLFGDCWDGWTGRSCWALRTSLTRLPCFTFESNALISLRKTEDKTSVTRDSNGNVFLNSRLSEIFLGQQRWSFLNCVALWHRQFLKKSTDWHMEWNQHLRGSSSRLIRRRPLPWVLMTERAGSPFLLSNRFLLESPVGREKTRRKLGKDGLVQISFPGSLLFLPFIVALEIPWNEV